MSRTRNQDFIRGTDRDQARLLSAAAAAVIAVFAVAFAAYEWVNPHVDKPDTLDLSIDVPYVAPGVHTGTKVILRGNEVGAVTSLTKYGDEAVRIGLALRPGQVRGLTSNFGLDFRPENYFGVTAVNLAGAPGGDSLASGQVFDRRPVGDYSMSTMIEQGSLVVNGTLTTSMIATLDKVIRYTDGLTPLIQAGIIIANRAAQTQQAVPSALLADMNRTLAVLPFFSGHAIDSLYNLYDNELNRLPDGSFGADDAALTELDQGLTLVANGLFGAAGTLLASHGRELTPGAEALTALFGVVPNLLDGGAAPSKLSTLVDRYNRAFTGPAGDKTLNLRLDVDVLPVLATPAGLPVRAYQEVPR